VVQHVIQAVQGTLQVLQGAAKADQGGDRRQKTLHEALKGHQHAQAQVSLDDPEPTEHEHEHGRQGIDAGGERTEHVVGHV
jgi:hypothetical protein